MRTLLISTTALAIAWTLAGCEGKAPYAVVADAGTPQHAATEARPTGHEAAPHAGPREADARPEEAPPQVQEASPSQAEPPDDLGLRFRDPPWFRKEMFEGATAVNVARSERDANGLFKSHILFDMPEGTTTDSCAELAASKISSTVPTLERQVQDDGRIQLTGSTDRYRVTVICGEAKGVMKAYVGYEWTS